MPYLANSTYVPAQTFEESLAWLVHPSYLDEDTQVAFWWAYGVDVVWFVLYTYWYFWVVRKTMFHKPKKSRGRRFGSKSWSEGPSRFCRTLFF